jgi:hypothetical protein
MRQMNSTKKQAKIVCSKCDWANLNKNNYSLGEVVDFYKIQNPSKYIDNNKCYGCFGDLRCLE